MDLSSDALLQQKKGDDEVVKWNEFVALQNSLKNTIDKVNEEVSGQLKKLDDHVGSELQGVDNSIDCLVKASEEQNTKFNTMQNSVTTITQQLAALTTLVNQRLPLPEDNASASVHNGGNQVPIFSLMLMEEVLHNYMVIWVIILMPRDENNEHPRVDDGLGRIKFSIPPFSFDSNDVEEFIKWELKIEKLWRLHDFTEDKKIKLAASEFDGYAMQWWDNLVEQRAREGMQPIITWRTMKQVMRDRFVPPNYVRSLYDKLQNLRQGTMTVDEYYKEMELILQRARVREEAEQTMQRFLSGLHTKFEVL